MYANQHKYKTIAISSDDFSSSIAIVIIIVIGVIVMAVVVVVAAFGWCRISKSKQQIMI